MAGESVRSIGARFGVSPWSVSRHHTRHLSPSLVGVEVAGGGDGSEPYAVRLERLLTQAETMFAKAVESGQGAQALNVLKEMRSQLELIGKATGELDTRPVTVVNLQTAPEWLAMRAVILAALTPYPEARAVVSGRLLQLEAGDQ